MTFIDWFAGVGGFRKGMEQAGHECVGFCEFDKFAVMSYTSMHLVTDEQRTYLSTLDMKQRQKEILKEEYRNGEWYADDIRTVDAGSIPAADCWCFGFPCQDISVSGKQLGFTGNRSSLFFRVMYLLGQIPEEKRPHTLFIENVKNLLSVNGGWDFARLLIEMDRVGYDAEWQVVNSKFFNVPQNRERCFIVGHIRGRSASGVFPVEGTDKENHIHRIGHRKGFNRNYQVFDRDGITETLDTGSGGGRGLYSIEIIGNIRKAKIQDRNKATYASRPTPYVQHKVAIPCLTPDRVKKRQNGRRFKEDGEEMFTLTAMDRHGVAVSVESGAETANQPEHPGIYIQISNQLTVYAVWYPKKQCYIAIRKLTPKECFRLQGWDDEDFEKAQFMNSDSQLYKQAGNGVTVSVIRAIAEKLEGGGT